MQQKQIWKIQQVLIQLILLIKTGLTHWKSDVHKLNFDKLKNVPINLRKLQNIVDKLDVDILVPVPVNLSKLSDVVKNDVVK